MLIHQFRVSVGAMILLALFWFSPQLMAASIPTVSPPEGGSDDIIAVFWGFAKVILRIIFILASIVITLVVLGVGISGFSSARKSGEWGNFLTILGVGLVLMVGSWFLAGMGVEMIDGA